MMPLPLLGYSAAWIASEAAGEIAADIEAARLRAGYTRKEFAGFLGISEKQYSDQITLKQPLNLYRLADAPMTFWRQLVILRAQRVAVQVVEDAKIAELMKTLDQIQVRMLKLQLRQKARKEAV